MKNLYQASERAYASLDFYGRGYITDQDFLSSIILKRIPFTTDEVFDFFKHSNLFSIIPQSSSGHVTNLTNMSSIAPISGNNTQKPPQLETQTLVHGMNFD